MSEPLKALPSDWIVRLFSRFQAVYGNRVQTMWKDADPSEVRQVWADELGHYEGEDIRRALEAMGQFYKDYPPTLYQFADLCRDARKRRADEAVKLEGPRLPMPEAVRAQLREFMRGHAR